MILDTQDVAVRAWVLSVSAAVAWFFLRRIRERWRSLRSGWPLLVESWRKVRLEFVRITKGGE